MQPTCGPRVSLYSVKWCTPRIEFSSKNSRICNACNTTNENVFCVQMFCWFVRYWFSTYVTAATSIHSHFHFIIILSHDTILCSWQRVSKLRLFSFVAFTMVESRPLFFWVVMSCHIPVGQRPKIKPSYVQLPACSDTTSLTSEVLLEIQTCQMT